MSAETLAAIEEAIKAHLADVEAQEIAARTEDGTMEDYHEHILHDFVVAYQTSGISMRPNGELDTCWMTQYVCPNTSSPMMTLGLARWLDNRMTLITAAGDLGVTE